MLSRSYDKKVEIYTIATVDDGFGGFTLTETLLKSKWCFIDAKKSFRTIDNGLVESTFTTIFNFRGGGFSLNEKTNFIKYKDVRYVIDTIEEVNLESIEIKAYCNQYNG